MGGFSPFHWLIMLPFLLAFVAMYFAPAIIAVVMKHPHAALIVIVDLLFGWTVLGWIGCFIWAFIRPSPSTAVPSQPPPTVT